MTPWVERFTMCSRASQPGGWDPALGVWRPELQSPPRQEISQPWRREAAGGYHSAAENRTDPQRPVWLLTFQMRRPRAESGCEADRPLSGVGWGPSGDELVKCPLTCRARQSPVQVTTRRGR